MLEMRQSIGNMDTAIVTSLQVFGWKGSGQTQVSEIEAKAAASALHEQHQPTQAIAPADLKDHYASWLRCFKSEIEAKYEATGSGLEIIADVLQEEFEHPRSFGLPCINNVGEARNLRGEHLTITAKQTEDLRRFIEQLAAKMGVQHPSIAATAAVLVIDETIVRNQISASPDDTQTARLLFQCLQHA